jgi:ATP-dependent Clp protease ATP-binding subunit ClpB
MQPPELLNRLSEIVPFSRLQRENMQAIAQIGLRGIAKRLENGQNMTLDVSPLALECISEKGYDIRYGARPLKRVLARDLLNPLSRIVLEGGVIDGDVVKVRTRAEADKLALESPHTHFGYLSSSKNSTEKNDVVVLRNHNIKEDVSDDQEVTVSPNELLSG